MKNKIGVIGSINTDLISTTSILPKMGETVIGNDFMITYGGKGANVAVAASRLGSSVNMFGCVGDDSFSKDALANLLNEGVHIRSVKQFKNTMCGVASIIVHNGNNQIISILGANGKLDKSYVTKCENVIKECSIIGCQFCVDVEALLVASRIAKENNIKFVLNPSPIKKYDKELFDNATYVIVNEIEVETIKGYNKLNPDEVLTLYPNKLIVTKGDKGASFFNGKEIVHIPAISVSVVDTTGAGDTFLASFMTGIINDMSIETSIRFANICAGLKTTKMGAQVGMPKLAEVKSYIKKNKIDLKINF